MTDSCIVCGSDAAPGRFGTRCVECIETGTREFDTGTIILETYYEYSGATRLIAQRTDDGWTVSEQRLMEGGEWKPVGSESATDVTLRTQK